MWQVDRKRRYRAVPDWSGCIIARFVMFLYFFYVEDIRTFTEYIMYMPDNDFIKLAN